MNQAGLFRIFVPREQGGYEVSLRTGFDIYAEVARGCGSTAWVNMILTTINPVMCLMPDQAQEEIFGANADARVAGVFVARGKARRLDGAYVMSGTWPFCSGCQYSEWVAFNAAVTGANGEIADEIGAATAKDQPVSVEARMARESRRTDVRRPALEVLVDRDQRSRSTRIGINAVLRAAAPVPAAHAGLHFTAPSTMPPSSFHWRLPKRVWAYHDIEAASEGAPADRPLGRVLAGRSPVQVGAAGTFDSTRETHQHASVRPRQ